MSRDLETSDSVNSLLDEIETLKASLATLRGTSKLLESTSLDESIRARLGAVDVELVANFLCEAKDISTVQIEVWRSFVSKIHEGTRSVIIEANENKIKTKRAVLEKDRLLLKYLCSGGFTDKRRGKALDDIQSESDYFVELADRLQR
jgi:hypothetical protein